MAFDITGLTKVIDTVGGTQREWWYRTTDAITTVVGSLYFAGTSPATGYNYGMRSGDIVVVFKTDTPSVFFTKVTVAGSTGCTVANIDAGVETITTLTVSGATTLSSTLSVVGPTSIASAAAGSVGFYGAAATTQRASSVQATTNLTTSASFGTYQVAVLQEVMNTLAGLGLWKASA